MAIHFHTIDTNHVLRHKNALKRWITDCIHAENLKPGDLNIILCSDNHLLEINREFLDHDYYTDIITFNHNTQNLISGDIFISIDRVFENASTFDDTPQNETYRVIIHGVMHLCGYNDKTKKEASSMRKKENDCLNRINKFLK